MHIIVWSRKWNDNEQWTLERGSTKSMWSSGDHVLYLRHHHRLFLAADALLCRISCHNAKRCSVHQKPSSTTPGEQLRGVDHDSRLVAQAGGVSGRNSPGPAWVAQVSWPLLSGNREVPCGVRLIMTWIARPFRANCWAWAQCTGDKFKRTLKFRVWTPCAYNRGGATSRVYGSHCGIEDINLLT